jgi:Na+-translocating ferredoxin:NAD+ oxidoreductase RnfD subunit
MITKIGLRLHSLFYGDIYKWMILILIVTAAVSAWQFNYYEGFLPAIVAVLVAGLLDTGIKSWKKGYLYVSKSGIISGLFVGLLLTPDILFAALASAIAILGKHIIKWKGRHLFNPANFGLLAVGLFGVGTGWWGSYALIPVLVFGLFVLYRVERFTMAVSFLLVYALLTVLLAGNASAFVALIANSTILFFAFFMLTEHKTSPFTRKGQVVYGVFVGLLSAILIYASGFTTISYVSAFYINIALFFGNILAVKVK